MREVQFVNAGEEQNKVVAIEIGKLYGITVWDIGYLKGTITAITDEYISFDGEFVEGCYLSHEVDYSGLKAVNQFTFKLEEIYSIIELEEPVKVELTIIDELNARMDDVMKKMKAERKLYRKVTPSTKAEYNVIRLKLRFAERNCE